MNIPLITIDGGAATGKGAVASALAKKLNFNYLDSGIYYRVLAYITINKKINLDDIEGLKLAATKLDLKLKNNRILLKSDSTIDKYKDITFKIRSEKCSKISSHISKYQSIRDALLNVQRLTLQPPGLIAEGRDMGTVVFPEAKLKFYFKCDINIRAKRRQLQLKNQGGYANIDSILQGLIERDGRDLSRSQSPLRPADDALVIDTSNIPLKELILHCFEITKATYKL